MQKDPDWKQQNLIQRVGAAGQQDQKRFRTIIRRGHAEGPPGGQTGCLKPIHRVLTETERRCSGLRGSQNLCERSLVDGLLLYQQSSLHCCISAIKELLPVTPELLNVQPAALILVLAFTV